MNVLTRSRPTKTNDADRRLTHWLWVLPVLWIVAALGMRQIDLYPPTVDEFYSMYNSGWLINGPYSPLEVLQSLQRNSPNHTPFYFLLLSLWGNLTAAELPLARVLGILLALLALAVVYRLGTDFVGKPAGLFAVVIISSNAYYNFHIAFGRMYTLLLLLSGLVLWLYLRITYRQQKAKQRDLLALGAAVYLLVNTFLMSATFMIMLGIFHLLIAPKNRRWMQVSIAVIVAVLLFSPWLTVVIPDGVNRFAAVVKTEGLDGVSAVIAWLAIYMNGEFWLLILSAIGIALGVRLKSMSFYPWLLMFVPFLLTLAALAQLGSFIAADTMRYHLVGWIPFVLFLAAGLYGLYRFKRWLGLLALLWVAASFSFQSGSNWYRYLADRAFQFTREPMQIVSRQALQREPHPPIITYKSDHFILKYPAYIRYSQWDFYFGQHDLVLESALDLAEFEALARFYTIASPSIWVLIQESNVSDADAENLTEIMRQLNYGLCASDKIGVQTIVKRYEWFTLDCAPPTLVSAFDNEVISYEFYGARLDEGGSAIVFNDRWDSRALDDSENYRMSFQLISEDWKNASQLDLEMVLEGKLRQFTIGATDVPAGTYRLMLILYDASSGERVAWRENPDNPPEFLPLAQFEIPQVR